MTDPKALLARRALAGGLARSALSAFHGAGMGAEVIGSLARGRFLPHSDVDILVVTVPAREAEAIDLAGTVFGDFPHDLVMAHRITPAMADLMRAEAVACAPYATVRRRAAILEADLCHLARREALASEDDADFLRDGLAEVRAALAGRVARRVGRLVVSVLADADGEVPVGEGECNRRVEAFSFPNPLSGRSAVVSAVVGECLAAMAAWDATCRARPGSPGRAAAAEGAALAARLVPALLSEVARFVASDAVRAGSRRGVAYGFVLAC